CAYQNVPPGEASTGRSAGATKIWSFRLPTCIQVHGSESAVFLTETWLRLNNLNRFKYFEDFARRYSDRKTTPSVPHRRVARRAHAELRGRSNIAQWVGSFGNRTRSVAGEVLHEHDRVPLS